MTETTCGFFKNQIKRIVLRLLVVFSTVWAIVLQKHLLSRLANDKNLFKRRVAFSNALSKLEDWTIVSFEITSTSCAPFPVTEAPKEMSEPRL